MTSDDKRDIVARMKELMEPIDKAIMMSDNISDIMMIASNMIVTAKLIYLQNLGGKNTKEIFQNITDKIDERILPLDRKIPPL